MAYSIDSVLLTPYTSPQAEDPWESGDEQVAAFLAVHEVSLLEVLRQQGFDRVEAELIIYYLIC